MVDLKSQPTDQLERMADAGRQIRECYRLLGKSDANAVGEVLRGQGKFYEWDHYPKGDVYDRETHSQYYYHAHPVELRGGEHGHFHTFLRPKGMPPGIEPEGVGNYEPLSDPDDALSHLVAISMDQTGLPIRIFTTNRWVTGEVWYAADDVIAMLDNFMMDLAYPSWPVNVWITSMMVLFRPQIEDLLRARDRVVAEWAANHPDCNVYEDRDLDITSMVDISVEGQIAAIDAALGTDAI